MAQLDIDLSNDAPLSSRDPLPTGTYLAVITDSTIKPTKDQTGRYLELTFQVIDGEHKGRLVWDRMGLWYASAKAAEIARRSLRSLTDAIGHSPVVKDSATLHNAPVLIDVTLRQDPGYQPTNEVKGYKVANGSPAPRPVPAPAPATGARPVWAK